MRIVPTVIGSLALCGEVWAQTASPKASPSPSPSPSIVIDVDRHVGQMLEEEAKKGTPRFETSIEVYGKSPQIMLERFFGGVDLECKPGGAPPGGGAAPPTGVAPPDLGGVGP